MHNNDEVCGIWRASYRCSITAALFAAMFWALWYLIAHSVPVSPEWSDLYLHLPGVSRWWDVLAWPLLVFSFVWFGYSLSWLVDRGWLWEGPSMFILIIGVLCALIFTSVYGLLLVPVTILLTAVAIVVYNLIALVAIFIAEAVVWVATGRRDIGILDWFSGE